MIYGVRCHESTLSPFASFLLARTRHCNFSHMVPLPQVVTNVAAFCACAGMGQLFVFFIIKEFGSLVNVTVTISRKFFR